MTAMEAIRSRRSVRSFDGRPLPEEVLAELKRFADSVENPYELPIVWKILDGRARDLTSPVIIGTDTWIAGKMRRAPHAEEAFGFAFERVVLYAAARGIGTTWIAGTMDRPAFERAMGLKKGEVMPCVSPLGYPAAKMSLRETVMRKTIKADSRLPFEQLFFVGGFDKPLTAEEAGRLALPLELVRLGPSAVNKQPWRAVVCGDDVHFYEKHSRGYGADGWDVQKVDMGIALCHFACGAEELGCRLAFRLDDPGLPVPEDTAYIATVSLVSNEKERQS